MRIEFARLFEVLFYHSYYTSGISRDFIIEPAARCRQLLRNYGLLFKKTPQGFVVLYEIIRDEADQSAPLKSIEEEIKLSFILKPSNPYLLNYSDLPLRSEPNHLYRLHNMNDNLKNDELLLTSSTNINHLSQSDRIEVKPQLFQYRRAMAKTVTEMELIDEWGASVTSKTLVAVEDLLSFTVDLTGRPPGRYLLKLDGEVVLDFYASDELMRQNAFGVVDLFSGDLVPEAYRFVRESGEAHPRYVVRLETRRTYWKYHVAFKYYERDKKFDPKKVTVNHPDASVSFESQEVFDEKEAIPKEIFLSDRELSLTEAPVKGIDLKLKKSGQGGGDGNKVDLRKNLPNPSVRSVKPDEAGSKVYSEIFVYL